VASGCALGVAPRRSPASDDVQSPPPWRLRVVPVETSALNNAISVRPQFTVWGFPSAEAARGALELLRDLERNGVMKIDGAALASWTVGRREPETCEFYRIDPSAETKRVWRDFFRSVFYDHEEPSEFFADLGVDDPMISEVREQLAPGRSSLFILTSGVFEGYLESVLRGFETTVVHRSWLARATN
jgi:hypothetical protein